MGYSFGVSQIKGNGGGLRMVWRGEYFKEKENKGSEKNCVLFSFTLYTGTVVPVLN
jgi:hypothetical protein